MRTDNYPIILDDQREEAVRSFLQKVYIWMCGGLILTGVVAYQVFQSPVIFEALVRNRALFFGLMIAELALVIGLGAAINRISSSVAALMFIVYAALNGVTLSFIFAVYQMGSIAQVFFISAGMFAGMSAYGYVTKKDLTSMGSFMIMGLWGIILASLVNFFLKSPAVSYAVSIISVFIFLGLTAYDTQKLKNFAHGSAGSVDESTHQKTAIVGALMLYLDFINLFLNLLRLFGRRNN